MGELYLDRIDRELHSIYQWVYDLELKKTIKGEILRTLDTLEVELEQTKDICDSVNKMGTFD